MCDTIFYPSLTGEDDIRWREKCQTTAKLDITSIINSLEDGSLDKLIEKTGDISQNLIEDITIIEKWVDTTLQPALLGFKRIDIANGILKRLNFLWKHMREIVYNVQNTIPKRKKFLSYECRKCHVYIGTSSQDVLSALEQHTHLEPKFDPQNHIEKEILYLEKQLPHFEKHIPHVKQVMPHLRKKIPQKEILDTSEESDEEEDIENDEFYEAKSTSSISTNSISFRSQSTSENENNTDVALQSSHLLSYVEDNYVTKILYPKNVLEKIYIAQRNKLITVQSFKNDNYRCLICDKNYTNEEQLLKHVKEPAHSNKMIKPFTIQKLRNYHAVFSQLRYSLCIHQVVFIPGGKLNGYQCKLCDTTVPQTNLAEHINGFRHKSAMLDDKMIKCCHFYADILASVVPTLNKVDEKHDTVKSKVGILRAMKLPNQVPHESNSNKVMPLVPEKRKHNLVKSLVKNAPDIFSSLELRFQEHIQFIKEEDDKFVCNTCKVKFGMKREELKKHIISDEHAKNVKKLLPRRRWFYNCDLCFKFEHSENNWFEHLNSIAHKQRISTVPMNNLKGGPFMEYECEECWVVIFGNIFTINRHKKEPVSRSRKKRKKEYKLSNFVEKLLRNDKLLDETIMKLTIDSDKSLELEDLNMKCCRAIERVIESIFPTCRALPFGSRVSGIGCMNSDLDVFVDTGMMYDGLIYQDADSQASLVRQITKVLRKHPDFTDINPIPQARTPIIQVYHKATKIDCDLSFRHGLSVENTEFLRLCIDVQPILKPLILILKYWMHECYFDKISTYALCMMVIFFMQTNNFLPCVKLIRQLDSTPSRTIAGWQTFRFTKPLEDIIDVMNPCHYSIKHLMMKFFKYYTEFNYEENVVCPLLGYTILKKGFSEEDGLQLPDEMDNYVQKIKGNENNERFRYLCPMCIQDPFDLSHNLTKACPIDYVNRFSSLCCLSYKILAGED